VRSESIGTALLLCVAASATAEDFTLDRDGYGPIRLHAELSRDVSGEHLIATATNAGREAIPYMKFCLAVANQRRCLFTFWNTHPWAPGTELNWALTAKRRVTDLAFKVNVAVDTGKPPVVSPPPSKPAAVNIIR